MPHPLHPAVVHFPLVLAVLLPFLALAALLAARRAGLGRPAWVAVVVFALLLPLSAWAAVGTGGQQEEVVEGVVPEGALEGHEEAAEGFLAASAVLAVIISAGLLPGRVGRAARWIAMPASVAILALAVRVGDSGGKLVYTHGAATAYATAGVAGAPPSMGLGEGDDRKEGHEERH